MQESSISGTIAPIWKGYSPEDKKAARELLEELKAKQAAGLISKDVNIGIKDVVCAVEPTLETPAHLKAA